MCWKGGKKQREKESRELQIPADEQREREREKEKRQKGRRGWRKGVSQLQTERRCLSLGACLAAEPN